MNVKEFKEAAAVLRSGGRLPLEVFREYKRKCWANGIRWHAATRRSARFGYWSADNTSGNLNTKKK